MSWIFICIIVLFALNSFAQNDDPEKFIIGKWQNDTVWKGEKMYSTVTEYFNDLSFSIVITSFKKGEEGKQFEGKGTYEIRKGKSQHGLLSVGENGKRLPAVSFKIINPNQMNFYVYVSQFKDEVREYHRILPEKESKTASISLGMTEQEVIETFGEPEKKAVLSDKSIYKYKDMTVTFVAGKASDVQFD